MANEFELRVIDIDSKLNIVKHFHQTPKCEVQLSKEVIDKLGFADRDLIEVVGKRMTAARVVSVDKDSFDDDVIGLPNLIRNNVRVFPEETVIIRRADSKMAQKIVLAPIEKHLKKSELLTIVAKKSFLNTPFVEGDVTYLRSKILRYLLGSVTWLNVAKTNPSGVIVANGDTDFEIVSDPIRQNLSENTSYYLPDPSSDDFWEKDLLLDEKEWEKINSLFELGLFSNLTEVISFFLREGIRVRSDIFEKTAIVTEQIKQIKENIGNVS